MQPAQAGVPVRFSNFGLSNCLEIASLKFQLTESIHKASHHEQNLQVLVPIGFAA